jgi:hypothetical protein
VENLLTRQQEVRALQVMREYLEAKGPDQRPLSVVQGDRDRQRLELIGKVLCPLVNSYLGGKLPLANFKTEIDSINKKNEYWGFKGIKGQMFFNMVVNVSPNETEVDQELRAAIIAPTTEEQATVQLTRFGSYVRRLGEAFVEAGGSLHGRPKVGSSPFFLSYFWQIQQPQKWPAYYTNSVQVMTDLNLWTPSDNLATDYVAFKRFHEELAVLFSRESGKSFGLYDVEHVFWFVGGNSFRGDQSPSEISELPPGDTEVTVSATTGATSFAILPESYVPPIVQIIPRLARNDSTLADAAKAAGISISRALEKSVDAAFSILGFDVKLLGQGQGRVPDGLAIDSDNSYAIIWDSKARTDRYSMGTDDRTIREYVVSQSRDLRRKRGLRNVYYVIISGAFADDYDDPVRSLKMETDVSEVILMEADALVAMVEARLRSPREVTLGPDGLQRLFTDSAVLDANQVRELLA